MEGKGENGLVEGSSDIEEDRAKMRPADIDADVREMERRKRVEAMMSSRLFREELERIVEAQMKDGGVAVGPLLQQIQDMMQAGPARAATGYSVKSTNCVIPINDIRGVESMGYAKGEKILRCKLAAVYRLMDLYGWTQGINNHITGRLNEEEELLLVNAYGMLYHEVTASSLVKVDMQGCVVEQGTTNYGVNVHGFHLHAAIHQARPDIKCIIHVHTPAVLAVSSLKAGLLPLSNESVVIGEVSSHQSSGSMQEPEEKDKLARNLGPINKVMLLSNNGAVCCGETVEEAFFNVYNTVLACESQMKVMPLGVENLVLMQDEARKAVYDSAHRVPDPTALPSTTGQPTENKEKRWRIGGLHFEALMRMLDNAGFRTGYIYRTPLIKGDPPKPKSDVEVPPAVSSLGYLLEEEEMYRNWKKMGGTKNDRTRWLNSPNVYQKVEILETGTPDPKKITKWVDANADEWVADGSPTHSSTPVKIADALQFVPKNTNPKEFKKLQQQIKENRRADKITSGPQSHILEGVSWEDAKKLQDGTLPVGGDQVVLVGAASKGIIQREYQHNATVYKTPYAKNPFDSVSNQEIEEYRRTVTRKQRGESYDEEQSESEALSSSAALPPTGIKSPPSETDEDSRTEPRVLRIQTKTAPIPSQAEYVLSDDFPRKPETEKRIRCFTRMGYTPPPACKERPYILDISLIKESQERKVNLIEKMCVCCKGSLVDSEYSRGDSFSCRSTQTFLTIQEYEDKSLCQVSNSSSKPETSPPRSLNPKGKRPPVARKLAMDSVIDELKGKFRLNSYKDFDIIDLNQDKNHKNSDEELTSCSIHRITEFVNKPINGTGQDFSSEGTATTGTCSSLDSPKESKKKLSNAIEHHIGNEYQGSESMSERPSPQNRLPDKYDSFLLSDLLSSVHINDDREANSYISITHHTNTTKKAFLMKNDLISNVDCGYSPMFRMDESLEKTLMSMDFTETGHSTSCEGSQIGEEQHDYLGQAGTVENNITHLNNYSSQENCININNNVDEDGCAKHVSFKSPDNLIQVQGMQPLLIKENGECQSKELTDFNGFLSKSNLIEDKLHNYKLTIDGKDLLNFYQEFDPNEIFQKDGDDISVKVHYDIRSLVACNDEEEDCSTNTSGEEIESHLALNEATVVNENIFTGKKYLMNRYLSGNDGEGFDDLENLKLKDQQSLSDSSGSLGSISEKNNCGISEDSAVFSELTVKTNNCRGVVIDPEKIIEWSLSENSKGGLSVDSSGSSGIRLSSTSEEDVPGRPVISSMEEFLIKETLCHISPDMDQNSLCNSRFSYPADSRQSYAITSKQLKRATSLPNIFLYDCSNLLCNLKQRLSHSSYILPSKSTICSYYTLVAGLDRFLSLPDLSNICQSFNNISEKSFDSDCSSDNMNKDLGESEFDDHGVYISDDYLCPDSDSEGSTSGVLHFLNDSNNLNPYDTMDLKEQTIQQASHAESAHEVCDNDEIEDHVESLNNSCYPHQSSDDTVEHAPHEASSGIKIQSFKDCIKCFAISMEESIDHLFPSVGRRNKIIGALKKKFLKHKCNSYNVRHQFKTKTLKKSKSSYRRHSGKIFWNFSKSEEYSEPRMNYYKSYSDILMNKNNKNEVSNFMELDEPCSLYYSCNNDLGGKFNHSTLFNTSDSSPREDVKDFKSSIDSGSNFPENCNKLNEDHFSTLIEPITFSKRSESYFSLPTSSISSETETFYSFGNCEPTIDLNTSLKYSDENGLQVVRNFQSSFNSSGDLKRIDLNTAFILETSNSNNSGNAVNSDDDIDSYLNEIAFNVSSVSCQTDDSIEEDNLEYQPSDYTELENTPCTRLNACSRKEWQASPNSLYTIYETTAELSPEF